MNGYIKSDALEFILQKLDRKELRSLSDQIESLLSDIIDADMDYMFESGVLDENGDEGDNYYDDDEALQFVLEKVQGKHTLSPSQAMALVVLVSQYLELNQNYLESIGLVSWQ